MQGLKGYGYEDFIERIEVIDDEWDDRSIGDRFAARMIAIFDYMLVSESGGDPARIASVMHEIGMTDSAALVAKLTPATNQATSETEY